MAGNGDNELPSHMAEPLTARDLENQVIQEVLTIMTDTQLLEEFEAVALTSDEGSLTDNSTLSDWRQREQRLLDRIASLQTRVPVTDGETPKTEVSQLTKKLKIQNEELRAVLAKMAILLKDKTGMCATQESKLSAMSAQVNSLKEVVSITKDLLNIRNMEVTHLSQDMKKMQDTIDDERARHNQMLLKMEKMVNLNKDLKVEYETQLRIFQELRDKYEAKMQIADELQKATAEQG